MMLEIKCLKDIQELEAKNILPKELLEYVNIDLHTIKAWADQDEEYTFEEYNCDYSGNGYIIILSGKETTKELEDSIGLTGGLDNTIPEAVNICSFDGTLWRRILVIYNDSYANIIWVPNYDGLDSYAA